MELFVAATSLIPPQNHQIQLHKVNTIGIRITDVELLTEEKIEEVFLQGENQE